MKLKKLAENTIREYLNENNIREEKMKEVTIYKMENGFYWLRDCDTGELIDGDRRLYVVKDMANRWNYKIVKKCKQKDYNH
jgi:hypothetical protein